jgi:aspartate carbamoyltransferase catalytic subunit
MPTTSPSIKTDAGHAGESSVWSSRHLLGLQAAPVGELRALLRRARDLDHATTPTGVNWSALGVAEQGPLAGRMIANLFFEDSTRTRTSFAIAAARCGARVVDLAGMGSSVSKGETLVDTALNVEAMGVSALIVRAKQSGVASDIAAAVDCSVINAGDGKHEHPTQGLLDILTLAEAHGRSETFDLTGLTLAIVGDIAGSRVARSNIAGVVALGGSVVCVGPAGMAPRSLEGLGCAVSRDLDEFVPRVDAVMMLRIQFERYGEGAAAAGKPGAPAAGGGAVIASIREFREGYALTQERAARLKPGAIIMHPGPINRGLELDEPVIDHPRSRILRQVALGVAARMSALEACIANTGR